ncbi:hypothetical protein B0H12DRAFT_1124613, partial [Mycena haematopus]
MACFTATSNSAAPHFQQFKHFIMVCYSKLYIMRRVYMRNYAGALQALNLKTITQNSGVLCPCHLLSHSVTHC